MKTVTQILNSFWVGAAAFGVAGLVLTFMEHPTWAGAMYGTAVTKFISGVRTVNNSERI